MDVWLRWWGLHCIQSLVWIWIRDSICSFPTWDLFIFCHGLTCSQLALPLLMVMCIQQQVRVQRLHQLLSSATHTNRPHPPQKPAVFSAETDKHKIHPYPHKPANQCTLNSALISINKTVCKQFRHCSITFSAVPVNPPQGTNFLYTGGTDNWIWPQQFQLIRLWCVRADM